MHTNLNPSIQKITTVGMFTAITAILVFTFLGMIPLSFISLTIAHIPTIIASILYGPVIGALEGFCFGILTLIRAFAWPQGVLDPLFINPLVSVLPRTLMGFCTYFIYKGASRAHLYIGLSVSAALGSVINTIGCLGMLYLLYAKEIVARFGGSAQSFVFMVATSSGLAEMVVTTIITIPLILVLKKAFKL